MLITLTHSFPYAQKNNLVLQVFLATDLEVHVQSNIHDVHEKVKYPTYYMSTSKMVPHLNRLMTKPTKWHVCPAKAQISLGMRPV